MAKLYGPYKLIGTIGGIRHYRLNKSPEITAAGIGGANDNMIKNSPAFARTRENMAEMTPRSNLASQVKTKLGQWSVTVVNRYLIGAINSALRIAQKRDENGVRGCLSIYLSQHRDVLNIPDYYYYKPMRDIMKCPYTVETGADRKSVTVHLANLIPKEQIKPPAEATHFKFCLSIGVVCDMIYHPEEKRFIPAYGGHHESGSLKEFESEWIPINAGSLGEQTFTVALPENYVLEDDMTVLRIFGIVFGKHAYDIEPLKDDRGSAEFLGAI